MTTRNDELKVCFDPADLAWEAAEFIVQRATDAIRDRGVCSLALSGGSTPLPMFALLALPEWRVRIDWQKVHVFWVDERCVPPTHEDSNYHAARIALLHPNKVPEANIHRIQGERDPAEAAALYEDDLRRFFGGDAGVFLPRFDIVMLGMGADGHTASLFPGTAAVHEALHPVIAHYVEKVGTWRVTLTAPVINAAAHVAFMVSGADKAERLRQVRRGNYQPDILPAQIVRPKDGKLIWFVDKAAASLFDG